MPFGPVDPQLDLVALERRVLVRWRELDLASAVQRQWEGAPPWVFYEGPPTANGKPGLHHVWARAFKDLFPRFRTMSGHDVPRKGGWDCHGLPVEIEVEKELGFTRKSQIEDYGIANFNARCRESVQRNVGDWEALTERAGVWIDTKDAYWTLSNAYIESVWWLIKQLFDNGLLYEGYRVVPYCSRCGTALSSHELGQPGAYRDVTDPSVYVRFPLVGDVDGSGDVAGDGADLLVWTTTPWTLISNVGAAVGPDIDYVRVRGTDGGRDLIMAGARAPEGAEVVARFSGTDLVGRRYRRPFDFLPIDERGQRVVAAGFVSTEDGTGIVHLAPAFGVDDMDVARADDLPVLNPVGPDGTFSPSIDPWAGVWVKDADRGIVADLAARGLLVREEPYAHSYPHCWRCSTPLIYWAKTSWFVRTSDRRDDLLRENEKIGWYPDHIKQGRFGEWLRNNVDWALSRDRYWGTPLPIWRCADGHDTCVGSVAQLGELAGPNLDGADLAGLDLHRPHVDDVTFACPEPACGAVATRIAPVLDAWFDSGAMPSAQHHYPFGDRDSGSRAGFESAFPADFICEAVDQTRGWFYSLLAVNTLVFDSTPYRNVVCLAHVVDEFGQKMSKSKGNVIDPWQIFDTFGADALRWYFFSAGSPWTSRRVYEDGIREATRKTLITLWNVFSFFATYADLEGWEPPAGGPGDGEAAAGEPAHVLDRWLEARLAEMVGSVTEALEGFDALGGSNALAGFVDDLSNWYVRRSRPRFWGSSEAAAYSVLHRALGVTCRLLAPFCPFLADELFVTLTGETSVHLQRWPEAGATGSRDRAGLAGERLLTEMDAARRLVGLGRAARTDAGVRTRQPLRRAMLLHPGLELSDDVRREIAEELNVKALEEVSTLSDLMSWTVVPNFRALGPRLGPKVIQVKQALAAADGSELRRRLEADGYVEVAGEKLGPTDVEVRANQHEDYAVSHDEDWAVAIDLDIDDDLRLEGLARQLARDLNDLRRQRGLSLADRVAVVVDGGARVRAVLDGHASWIASQVLATSLTAGPTLAGAYELGLDGETALVDLRVVNGTPGLP